jgi:hypothetical protein
MEKKYGQRRCPDCGKWLAEQHVFNDEDECVGQVQILDCTYWTCKCGLKKFPNELLWLWDWELEHKRRGLIARMIFREGLECTLTTKQAARKLGISEVEFIRYISEHGQIKIFNIDIYGQRRWLKKSVEQFMETGDGTYPSCLDKTLG